MKCRITCQRESRSDATRWHTHTSKAILHDNVSDPRANWHKQESKKKKNQNDDNGIWFDIFIHNHTSTYVL